MTDLLSLAGGWRLGVALNAVIATAFLAIAAALGASLSRSRQWRTNPLGVGTFLLYVTCGGGHAIHALQLLDPSLGFQTAAGAAARYEYGDWHAWVADALTALAGAWYWTMRRRFPALVSGAAVYEDLRERRRRALEVHDHVVQGLARAKLALDLHHDAEGREAVEGSLEASKRIITDLLGTEVLRAGALRRRQASVEGTE